MVSVLRILTRGGGNMTDALHPGAVKSPDFYELNSVILKSWLGVTRGDSTVAPLDRSYRLSGFRLYSA